MPAAPPPKAQAKPSPPPLATPSPPPPKALPAAVPPQPQQNLPLIKAPPEPVPATVTAKTAPALIPVKSAPAQHPPARAYSQGRDAQKTPAQAPAAGPKPPPAHMIGENLPTPVLQPGQEKVPCRYGCGFSFDSVASEISHVGHCMHNANSRYYKENPDRLPAQANVLLAAQRRANSQEPR